MKTPPFELLTVLVATAESKNMIEAARKVGISQPGVSLKLKLLEEFVGFPVLTFEGKRKVLTHYGRALYSMAKKQVDTFRFDFEEVNRRYLNAKHLTFRIGSRPELIDSLAPRLLTFSGRIEFTALSSHDAVLRLLEHKIDLAISTERPDSAEIIAKKVLESRAHLLVHRSLMPKLKSKGAQLLKNKDFLTTTPALVYENDGHLLQDVIAPLGLSMESLNIRAVAQDWRVLLSLVEKGLGYAVVPNYIAARKKEIASVVVPESTSKQYDFYALYHRDLRSVPAFKKLLTFEKPL